MSDQTGVLFTAIIMLGILIMTGMLTSTSVKEEAMKNGLQECVFTLPGVGSAQHAWMKECPKEK